MHGWIAEAAEAIAARAPEELEALVAVSSPSGDIDGAEEAIALATTLAPSDATIERAPCSTPDHADDLILRLEGTGRRRVVLLGHVDTVISHDEHRPLTRDGARLLGSGTIDMKGGVVLSLGVLRALAQRRETFAEAVLLLVCDEEWRAGDFIHTERFSDFDGCLCFEGGELTADGQEAVVVRRKAAGTLQVLAHGRSAHSGANPDDGDNALLGLAHAATAIAGRHDPQGPLHLTAVPTVVRCGDAFNVVPATGELLCDLRADSAEAVRHGAARASRGSQRGAAGGNDAALLAGHGRSRGHRGSARSRRAPARPLDHRQRARRSQRRQLPRAGDRRDRRRPRAARRPSPRPGGVHRRGVPAHAGRGRTGAGRFRARVITAGHLIEGYVHMKDACVASVR